MNTIPAITIGLDLGDKEHAICVIDQAGSHSPWTSRLPRDLGHEVIAATPRFADPG